MIQFSFEEIQKLKRLAFDAHDFELAAKCRSHEKELLKPFIEMFKSKPKGVFVELDLLRSKDYE